MKWYHYTILICLSVAGILIWLYMMGTKKEPKAGEPGSIEYARAMKEQKSLLKKEPEPEPEPEQLTNEPTT